MVPPRTLLAIWLFIVAAALAVHLGSTPLYDADEGRNGEVGREMAATNDYVMPRIDGMPYLDKPIVYFAAEALAMEVLGPTALAARLPAYLFTLATALVVWWFAKRVWDEEAALTAAIAYLAMPFTMAFARTVIFDSALSFFVVVAIVAFYVGRPALGWAAIGFGVITKGPVAILLPVAIAIPFVIWSRRRGVASVGEEAGGAIDVPPGRPGPSPMLGMTEQPRIWSWWGLLLFVAIVAPWVWAVSQVVPDFLRYVMVTETMQRLATKALKRTGPPWYFIPYLIGGALPWAIVAIANLRKKYDAATFYAILWVAVPFLFFSLSQSKRPQYILPLMPAIALLAARAVKGFRAAAITWIALGVVLIGATPFVKMRAEFLGAAKTSAIALGVVALVAGLVAAFMKRRELAIIALSIPVIAIPLAADPVLKAIGERRSAHEFAQQLKPQIGPSTEIVGIEAYTGSLQFYLQRPITVVTPDAEEFTSNYIIRHYDKFADGHWAVRRTAVLDGGDRIFIVRNDDQINRVVLETHGKRLIATAAHFVAYR